MLSLIHYRFNSPTLLVVFCLAFINSSRVGFLPRLLLDPEAKIPRGSFCLTSLPFVAELPNRFRLPGRVSALLVIGVDADDLSDDRSDEEGPGDVAEERSEMAGGGFKGRDG